MHQNMYIWCIFTSKSRFSLRGQKSVYLMHFHVEKQVFLWHAKSVYIWCILAWKSRFSRDAPKHNISYIITWSRFSHDMPKMCILDAFLHGKAFFLVTPKNVYIWCIFTWKSRFALGAKKVYNWCTLTCKSRFLMKLQNSKFPDFPPPTHNRFPDLFWR